MSEDLVTTVEAAFAEVHTTYYALYPRLDHCVDPSGEVDAPEALKMINDVRAALVRLDGALATVASELKRRS